MGYFGRLFLFIELFILTLYLCRWKYFWQNENMVVGGKCIKKYCNKIFTSLQIEHLSNFLTSLSSSNCNNVLVEMNVFDLTKGLLKMVEINRQTKAMMVKTWIVWIRTICIKKNKWIWMFSNRSLVNPWMKVAQSRRKTQG